MKGEIIAQCPSEPKALGATSPRSMAMEELELTFVEAVVKPPENPFATALALITEKRQAVNTYRDEKKWLYFTGSVSFTTELHRKMQSEHRRRYGTSAPFSHKLIIQGATAHLYINTQGY